MGISWSREATDLLFTHSKGNVWLHRTLATSVVEGSREHLSKRELKVTDVESAIPSWRRSTAERMREMVSSLGRHYPDELGIVQDIVSDYGLIEIGSVEAA